MLSFTTASTHTLVSPHAFLAHFGSRFFPPCLLCAVRPRRVAGNRGGCLSVSLNFGCSLSGIFEVKRKGKGTGPGRSCWCKKGWDSEGDLALEAEILEFMKNSEKPDVFPSKRELLDAGRMDLVEAIQRQGGWLAFGWDLDNNDHNREEQELTKESQEVWDLGIAEKKWDNAALEESFGPEVDSYSHAPNSSFSASSSGRSLEAAAKDDCGIEGILSRLEKERNMSFGFGFSGKENSAYVQNNDHEDDFLAQTSKDVSVAGHDGRRRYVSFSPSGGIVNSTANSLSQNKPLSGIDSLRNTLKAETLNKWSLQRAGFSNLQFGGGSSNISGDEILEIRDTSSELDKRKESNSFLEDNNQNQIQSRLEHLELELSSVLRSLRSNKNEVLLEKGDGTSADKFQELSDVWEFQENEIMNAQDKLRSIRAKLAVVEGKMALAIIDTQKMLEQKQKRFDDTRRALRLLRTACIVWPNSASEVLLAGSFDGWATQRKMEKSNTGIFSLCLKLYPGRYEIKFIVDGEWRIDPLRPIVHNNGYENNLLIIT